jgi:hypothetical protein
MFSKKLTETVFAILLGFLLYKHVLHKESPIVTETTPSTEGAFVFEGEITKQSVDVLISKIRKDKIGTVIMSSPGGDMDEGLRLAQFVYENNIIVKVNSYCHSACTIAFFSSKNRQMGEDAIIGLHNITVTVSENSRDKRITLKEATDIANEAVVTSARVIAFYASVGIPAKDLSKIAMKQGDSILVYNYSDMKRLGFIK